MTAPLDYVAKCTDCNRLLGWCSGRLPARETAKFVSDWIRRGLSIDRMETEAARTAAWDHAEECPKKPKPKKMRQRKLVEP